MLEVFNSKSYSFFTKKDIYGPDDFELSTAIGQVPASFEKHHIVVVRKNILNPKKSLKIV